jgi:hypothetical protein
MITMKTLIFLFLTTAIAIGAEPSRDGGLSVYVLPNRVAEPSGGHGGFSVTDPATKKPASTYATPKELLTYFQQLPADVQRNGIWIITTDPDSYSTNEQAKLKELVALCVVKVIPIYNCRASELPNGWKRAK